MATTGSSSRSLRISNTKEEEAMQHILEIRRHKFFIGRKEANPLTQDLHHAVKSLSTELYTKDVHFLMELIQNAEDNEYFEGDDPTLEFVLTYKDITECGAPATLLVFNNEVGFSRKNMDSICSVGRTTKKKGKGHHGYIGEKGIGFKSVFLVSPRPHIFSNGYQVRFCEEPNQECGIGYIVPEWVNVKPTISDIQEVYGSHKILPTTTIVLPLRLEKVNAVKTQLSEVHPEILLFLSKIRRLSLLEYTGDSCEPVSAVSIFSEVTLSDIQCEKAEARIVNLSFEEDVGGGTEATCNYFIWRQAFSVKPESIVDERKDVEEWVVSLAFPIGERLKRGTSSAGIFAFLPTAMVTNFDFIIQADFILASSREAIVLDNKWNLGILACVPEAFVSAFSSYLKSVTSLWSTAEVFKFLPVRESSFSEFNDVRESIKTLLKAENIVPCASFAAKNKVFCLPTIAMRVLKEFRKLLFHMKEDGIPLTETSFQGMYILHSSLDLVEYDEILNFLGVLPLDSSYGWYGKFIQASNVISRASVDVYVELLCFLADNWKVIPFRSVNYVTLLKYVTWNGEVGSCSIAKIKKGQVNVRCYWENAQHVWLNKWNIEFRCPRDTFFLPDPVMFLLLNHEKSNSLRKWLTSAGVLPTGVSDYCSLLINFLNGNNDQKLVTSFAHLIYHGYMKNFIGFDDVTRICCSMPIIDASGQVHVKRTRTLVPAVGSKWIKLFRPDSIARSRKDCAESHQFENYVELGTVYAKAAAFYGDFTPEQNLLSFLIKHTGAADLPDLRPPDVELRVASTELTSDQAFLLLDWIRSLRTKDYDMPVKFIESTQDGKWMKTYSGFNSPNQCFLCNETEKSTLLNIGDVFMVLPVIDQDFYMNRIIAYVDELMYIGVRVRLEEAVDYVVGRLKCLISSQMSNQCLELLLRFIKYSCKNNKLDEDLLKTAKEGKWMKTKNGYMAPVGCVFLELECVSVSQISNLPVVDQAYYGSWIASYAAELKLLGVVVDLGGVFKLVADNFSFPEDLSTFTKDDTFLLLNCIKYLGPAAVGLRQNSMIKPWMRTSSGLRCPTESLLFMQEWCYLLNVVQVPLIDEEFYGSKIRSFIPELKEIGVAVELFEAAKMVAIQCKLLASSRSLTRANVILLLNCIKRMKSNRPLITDFIHFYLYLKGEKWLKTRHGYRSSPDSVLSDSRWRTISEFVDLPLIDSAFYGSEIYDFRDELKYMGVAVYLSDGALFVATGLTLPKDPAIITADCAFYLLQCIGFLRTNSSNSHQLEDFLEKLKGSKWLKTTVGYKFPEECILFDPNWKCFLEPEDAPFIDGKFYRSFASLGRDPMKAIGVKVDVEEVCALISKVLLIHTKTCVITRIYRFLDHFKWYPPIDDACTSLLWIPDQGSTSPGRWVHPHICVLHNRDNLFDSQLHVLDKYYDEQLLYFFSSALAVSEVPVLHNYVRLWNDWESGNHQVTHTECGAFWGYIMENWSSSTETLLKGRISKLPAITHSGDKIQLVDKEEVFMSDDLQLKKMFKEVSDKPLFVWSSEANLLSLPLSELYKIYTNLGVQKISESVQFDYDGTRFPRGKLEKVDLRNKLIGKGLIKLILGFLAGPCTHLTVKERQDAGRTLLELSGFESDEPIMVSYSLELRSSKERLNVTTSRMVLWDKNSCRLIVHKSHSDDTSISFVTCFARTISSGLLPNGSADQVNGLCKVIQLGFAFGFKEDVVDTLLLTENLELSPADKEFLSAAFPSSKQCLPSCPMTPSPQKKPLTKQPSLLPSKRSTSKQVTINPSKRLR